jgi:hypothetical protein
VWYLQKPTFRTLFLARRILLHWWWRRYVPLKCQFLQEPHGVTSQKTTFFIVPPPWKPQILHTINRLDSVAET